MSKILKVLLEFSLRINLRAVFRYSTFSAYKVLLGAHNITNAGVGTSTIRMGVSKIISHEEYIGRYSFDIALIKLIVIENFQLFKIS